VNGGVDRRVPQCHPRHRLYAAYHLIALRGLRRGEAAGLRWRDIDLDGATAIITCQLQQYDGRLVLRPPKTARSERAVALDRTTVAVLRAHEAAQEAERATLGKNYHDSGYVFTCLNGDPMAPDRLSRTSQPTPTRRCSPRSHTRPPRTSPRSSSKPGALCPAPPCRASPSRPATVAEARDLAAAPTRDARSAARGRDRPSTVIV
jgi:hypothetical protein